MNEASSKGLLQAHFDGPDWPTAGILLLARAVRKGHVVQPFWSAKRSIGQPA